MWELTSLKYQLAKARKLLRVLLKNGEDHVNVRAQRINVLHLLRDGPPPQSNHRSILFFAIHRGGSSFAGSLLTCLADRHQMIPVNLESHSYAYTNRLFQAKYGRRFAESLFYVDEHPNRETKRALRDLFRPRGYFYGALRDPYLLRKLPHRDKFTIILLLRDPRDVLTSMYYAIRQSHILPTQNRAQAAQMCEGRYVLQHLTIDEYVKSAVREFLPRYQVYVDLLRRSSNITLVRYEEMVRDFPFWVDRIVEASGLPVNKGIRRALIDAEDFCVDGEDREAHKRQVLPGDHLRKLQPETIEYLNAAFSDVLAALDYPGNAATSAAA